MIILFKYCANVENYESFRNFGYIYIYIYRWSYWAVIKIYISAEKQYSFHTHVFWHRYFWMFQCYKVGPTPYCDSDSVMKFRITYFSKKKKKRRSLE